MRAARDEADGVREFLDDAESRLLDLSIESSQADWVHATYITADTEALAARASARLIGTTVELAKASRRWPDGALPPEERRKSHLLRLCLPLVAPSDPAEARELTRLVAAMQGTYAKGRYQPVGASEPTDLQGLSRILTESRAPVALEDAWTGWHRIGRGIRSDFTQYVSLANRGARELGFRDTGEMWRSKYDMDPEEFEREVERLWKQVEPLYRSLHAYVRDRLRSVYGPERVPERGPIPAPFLGNMWAQQWDGIYPLLAPPGSGPTFDLTNALVARGTTAVDMVRFGESFFASLGLERLPSTFWERSLLSRPRDREVVCHASAWDLDFESDLRIKMCTEISAEDFGVVHHELGHNYYQRAYARQPFLFRDSAHDGFHEALGDTIALSITPDYLRRLGLATEDDPMPDDTGQLLARALEKVAFLPFGLVIDRWRWKVFSGEVGPDEYNRSWWEMRERYQGIAPPAPRGEEEFDPGAKYHVPANVPYVRYFLAHVLQFQFHRALVREAGVPGPLHRASIYGSRAAGERLERMMAMGASRPWPDALEALTGERRMDAGGLLEYFEPLRRWLDEQRRGYPVGW
ncbi:MAG TPA: M2 family metallopeptidase [Thermoplasmata archaeon]|nr:M2 family metallopeptidase [Thermoplasmata archaeon]